ncbi:hypothetical protein NDN08_002879 [Rhodosorus marinus]|uniref:DNA polymerase eta n=1 Tax=Rhodosorus marinus TaxID=101924 RepID=A0AAV8V0R2_9RHOD|nr:hypothetical protein NDN08_002879 [Rhodosorus marinus]
MAICEDRVIAHVDLDAFYAQVEMVRLGVDEEAPLCVQQWEGVIAVNYPARKRGVTRFDKAGEVKKKCPECILVHVEVLSEEQEQPKAKVSLARYREASARIFKLILREIERVERASIDEAYLDLTDMVKKRRGIRDNDENLSRASDSIILGEGLDPSRKDDLSLIIGSEITSDLRRMIREELGYTCSAGVAHNKTLAKLASAMNKPNCQTLVPNSCVQGLMEKLPFRKIRQLGGKLGGELEALGVETAAQVQCYNLEELSRRFGQKDAHFVFDIVRGIDRSEVVPRSKPKSMLAAKSLSGEQDWDGVNRWLRMLASELHDRMLFDEEVNVREARNLVISFKSGSVPRTTSKTLPMPRGQSNRLERMLKEMQSLLRNTPSFSFPIDFLGLTATNFEDKPADNESINKFLKPSAPGSHQAPIEKVQASKNENPGIKKWLLGPKAPPDPEKQAEELSQETADFLLAKKLQRDDDIEASRQYSTGKSGRAQLKKPRRGTIDSFLQKAPD